MTNAYGYLRVSGKGQVSGDGFDRQELAIRKYAAAHGIAIVRIWREEGVSGTVDGMDRPTWAELIEDMRLGSVNLVLIEKLDRLARDLMVQESIIADLRRTGLELVSAAEPDLCEDDPSRKLMRQMMGSFAEYEKAMIVLKLRGARERMKARTGRCEGRKPYGYRDGEGAVIAQMRAWRDAGDPWLTIARRLNASGVRSRTGREWHPYAVSRILEAC